MRSASGCSRPKLPLQMIAGQFALLAAITRKLSPRLRRFSWLVSALSWLGLLGLQPLRHPGQRAAHRRARRRVGHRSPHRVGRSVEAAGGRGHGQDARRGAHAADLPRLRARHRHQLRRLRRSQPPRHLATARPGPGRTSAGSVAGPRRRLDGGKQTPAGLSVDEPSGRVGLGVRGDQLPAQPALHLARPHRRRQAGAGVDQGAHRRVRRRPGLDRDHRRLGGRPPVVAGRPHRERSPVPARLRGRRHQRARGGSVLRPLRLHRRPTARPTR